MSQITIFNNDPTNVDVTVVPNAPPVDQSATVAALTAQVATLTAQVGTLQSKIAAAVAALA
mgnify:CR=1 FL=1